MSRRRSPKERDLLRKVGRNTCVSLSFDKWMSRVYDPYRQFTERKIRRELKVDVAIPQTSDVWDRLEHGWLPPILALYSCIPA